MKSFNIPTTTSKIRGGTFFTMVIFIMLLVSSALMYYYFQRTRALEREIMALRSGDPVESDRGGIFGFLPWNQQDDTAPETSPVAVATPAPAPAAEASSPPPTVEESTAYDGLPPSGAASTPRPTTGQPDVSAGNDVPAYSGLSLTEDPEQGPDILPPTDLDETGDAPESEVIEQGETSNEELPAGEVNSMYDAPPQVRVRAPQRD